MNNEKLTFWEAYSLLSPKIKWAISGLLVAILIFSFVYIAWNEFLWKLFSFIYDNIKIVQPIMSFISAYVLIWYVVQSSKVTMFIKLFFPKHLKDMEDRIMVKIQQVEKDLRDTEQAHEEKLASNFSQIGDKINEVRLYVADVDKTMRKDSSLIKKEIEALKANQANLEGQNEVNKENYKVILKLLSRNV